MGLQGDYLNVVKMESRDTSTGLKNWPCNLEKIHEDATRIVYVDDFNGSKIFIHVQRGGYVTIRAGNDTVINEYIETITRPVIHELEDGDKVCRWYFGDDHVIFRLEESGGISVSSNKIELVNLYCEPGNLKRVKDFLNRD